MALLAASAKGQSGGVASVDREKTWPAPTAEDWKRPCLITWQRSYEDALAVSRETGKAILVCVNMDGEVASEHYAGVRYRQPEIAALYEPYVCVIASVYRHNPRDYDVAGRRFLCPRFGSVTCGEHIAIEPGLYDKYFDGKRIAPRHIGVELDRKEMYDVYYAWDTDSVFRAIREGAANRPDVPRTVVRDDRPIVERVESRDVQDRMAVETAYLLGDSSLRRSLIEAAIVRIGSGDTEPVDLLRLAIFGLDVEANRLARRALSRCMTEGAIDLIAEALRVPMDPSEREALIAALSRLGETWPRARTLAAVHQGFSAHSSVIDLETWVKAFADAGAPRTPPPLPPPTGSDPLALAGRLEGRAEAVGARPDDPTLRLELAEGYLERGLDRAVEAKTDRRYLRLLFEDARLTALDAEKRGADSRRASSVAALSAWNLGDREGAYARAEEAVRGLSPETWASQGKIAVQVLGLFAEARQQAILKAVRDKTPWPPQWLTDVHAAYAVLARHPLGTDLHVAAHHDFLRSLGAAGLSAQVLDEGLARYPDSPALHDRLRAGILAEKGADGLEPTYEAMLAKTDAAPDLASDLAPNLEWFAGYASIVAAEFHRRARRAEPALAAYDRAIAHYERAIEKNADCRSTADIEVALALAGRARLAFERKDDERALAELEASFQRRPDAAATLDGLNLSAVDTARMLRARLQEIDRKDLAERLQAALDGLDPALLELPSYEREGPSGTSADGRPPRRRRAASDR